MGKSGEYWESTPAIPYKIFSVKEKPAPARKHVSLMREDQVITVRLNQRY